MLNLIEQHRPALQILCEKHGVRQLHVFGSATRADFDPAQSDLDFTVEFDTTSDRNVADQYFDLLFDLEKLFSRKIDLISASAIRNPYFREEVERTRISLYAA